MKSLFIDRDWELKLVDKVCATIRDTDFLSCNKVGILQLSYEYSGIMAQLLSHKLSTANEPIDIEPINIPYNGEFEVTIHPDQLDNYDKLIVLDSGCLSGKNFTNVKTILLDYGFKRNDLFFCCLACGTDSIFTPDYCPLYFNSSSDMIHFWWETKTNRFNPIIAHDKVS